MRGRVAWFPLLAACGDPDLRDKEMTWLACASGKLLEIASVTDRSFAPIYTGLRQFPVITPELADCAGAKTAEWLEDQGVAV